MLREELLPDGRSERVRLEVGEAEGRELRLDSELSLPSRLEMALKGSLSTEMGCD